MVEVKQRGFRAGRYSSSAWKLEAQNVSEPVMICGKWLGVKEVERGCDLRWGNIKSRDLYVPLEVFGLGDRVT